MLDYRSENGRSVVIGANRFLALFVGNLRYRISDNVRRLSLNFGEIGEFDPNLSLDSRRLLSKRLSWNFCLLEFSIYLSNQNVESDADSLQAQALFVFFFTKTATSRLHPPLR
jgi:hypothetical protein